MTDSLGPGHRERILAIVDQTTAQQDWSALERAYRDFRHGMDELREYFGQLRPAANEGDSTGD
ncbi:hypothetical protein ACFQ36_07425 [Arthrobacter sp. GCM10027362]|uniref:hypothetical protein n=1 Tax=Arthrobacter sp. GCM10027362 TaxID=3273379 RepID=UPI0036388A90